MNRCLNCTAEITNGLALCQRCQHTLTVALVNVAAYYADVLRIQPGQRVKVRSAYQSTPPPGTEPPRDPISDATDHVDTIIVGWTRNLTDDRPGIGEPPNEMTRLCGWLEARVSSIVTLEWAAEMLREVRECERMLQRILDRADTGWYAGVCGNEVGREWVDGEVVAVTCERGLYGTQSSAWVTCPECGRTWDAGARHDAMKREAANELAPVSVIARVIVGLVDEEVSVQRLTNRIDQWVSRGWLRDLGVRVLDGRPRRVYRIGDVLRLIEGDVPRREGEAC